MRDAVILEALRTPIGKRDGGLRNVHPVDLLGDLLISLLARTHTDPGRIEDVVIGCVDQVGEQSLNVARNAVLSAGFPESVPATTVDRQCGSSLQAIQFAAQGVMAGSYDLVLAGGVESMTRIPLGCGMHLGPGTPLTPRMDARYKLDGKFFDQALGAELVARKWGFGREALDRFGYSSHLHAAAARAAGRFDAEIVPVRVTGEDGVERLVSQDEGIRPNAALEKMATLPPAFPGLELITAGNASQISDAAGATLIASAEMAAKLDLRPRARFKAFAIVGVDPVTMLTGPIPATRKVLRYAGLGVEDIDLFEVNEAFSPVVLAWQAEIGAPWDRVNVNGGAIALGHPVGATGARIVATLLHELERRRGRYGLVTICEGGGMANAAIVERLDG